jgi:glutathione S-transferase
MTEPQNLELISFKLCPYVQRAVILLKEKSLDFKVTYIDLKNKPEWFLELSPLGKVPILKVGDTVLFESAVIAEYLDETHPPSLHPADPLQKAKNRAWIEFSSELLMLLYRLVRAGDQEEFAELTGAVRRNLERLEGEIAGGPYFNGEQYALVDAAFAPAFMRLALVEGQGSTGLQDGLPKVGRWSQALLERPAVKGSVVPEFPELFRASVRDSGGYLAGKAE